MKRFILIIVLLLFAILLAVHFIGGKMLSNYVDQALENYTSQPGIPVVSYSDLNISPLFASIRFEDFELQDNNSPRIVSAHLIQLQLSISEIFTAALGGFSTLESDITDISLHVLGFGYSNEISGEFLNSESLDFRWQGPANTMLLLLNNQSDLPNDWRVDFDLNNSEVSTNLLKKTSPFENTIFPDITRYQNITGSFRYSAEQSELLVNNFRVDAIDTRFNARGVMGYSSHQTLKEPEFANIAFQLNSPVRSDFRYLLSPTTGAISFSDISIESSIRIEDGELLPPHGETYLKLDRPIFYPAENVLQEYGYVLQSLPINPGEIDAQEFEAELEQNEDRLSIYNAQVIFSGFKAGISGYFEIDEAPISELPIQNGKVTISDASTEVITFIQNVEMLFDIQLERSDNQITIPLTGTAGRPALDMGL